MKFFPEISSDALSIVFLIFCGAIFIQLLYVTVVHWRLLLTKADDQARPSEPVSIIICARNEEDNLFSHLPKICEQDYPNFEVIVVIDQSVDDSHHIVKAYQKKYPHLKMIRLERNPHRKFGKKLPLTVGIKGAQYNKILLTDADCYPSSDQWIKMMMRNYTEGKEVVLGYGPYQRKKGLLNKFIRFDTAQISVNYLGLAKSGRPYMGVGRNMTYDKSLFFEVDGFKKHYHIQSGDDDLFIQDVAKRKNVGIEMHPKSFVYSLPKESWSGWIKQKQRHFTTAGSYRLINKLFLGIFPMSMFLMWLCFVTLLISYEWWLIVLSLFLLRYSIYWLIDGLLLKKLGQKDLIWGFPLLELAHFVVMPFIFYSTDRETDKW